MRARASKAKAGAGRRPKAGDAAGRRKRIDNVEAAPARPALAAGEAPRGPGSKLVHELGGTLATISLHLRMASESPLPRVSAQHLDAAAQALHASRNQLAQLGEILLRVEPPQP
jgi:hypothetical protein